MTQQTNIKNALIQQFELIKQQLDTGLITQQHFNRLVTWCIRLYSDEEQCSLCSKKAYKKLLSSISNISSIFNKTIESKYRKQLSLVQEHITPISTIRECLQNGNKSVTEIVDEVKVCWITKEEDNKLNQFGFNNNRPNGWQDAYNKCGIEVIKIK